VQVVNEQDLNQKKQQAKEYSDKNETVQECYFLQRSAIVIGRFNQGKVTFILVKKRGTF
jgi:hypothetical protein